jgi:chorismate mutase/prephenate dehydrogenase|tara:strand:+ start:1287 stop:1550 length:264 start_codon:yes stop_codon:yes gene_type:complete
MEEELQKLRDEIDEVDLEIIELLSKRKITSEAIGELKKKSGKEIIDEDREKKLIESLKKKAEEKGLDEEYIESLFRIIISKSREEQK